MSKSTKTFAEIQVWTTKVIQKFGKMVLIHAAQNPGYRFKIVAYAIEVARLKDEIEMKIDEVKDVDVAKYDDLVILDERIESLSLITFDHFKIHQSDLNLSVYGQPNQYDPQQYYEQPKTSQPATSASRKFGEFQPSSSRVPRSSVSVPLSSLLSRS